MYARDSLAVLIIDSEDIDREWDMESGHGNSDGAEFLFLIEDGWRFLEGRKVKWPNWINMTKDQTWKSLGVVDVASRKGPVRLEGTGIIGGVSLTP